MNRFVQPLMLSCQKASEFIEKGQVQKLSWAERAQLWMHNSICKGCKAYQTQSEFLNNFIEQKAKRIEAEITAPQLAAFQMRVISTISQAGSQGEATTDS